MLADVVGIHREIQQTGLTDMERVPWWTPESGPIPPSKPGPFTQDESTLPHFLRFYIKIVFLIIDSFSTHLPSWVPLSRSFSVSICRPRRSCAPGPSGCQLLFPSTPSQASIPSMPGNVPPPPTAPSKEVAMWYPGLLWTTGGSDLQWPDFTVMQTLSALASTFDVGPFPIRDVDTPPSEP